jgi:hypothetical protein
LGLDLSSTFVIGDVLLELFFLDLFFFWWFVEVVKYSFQLAVYELMTIGLVVSCNSVTNLGRSLVTFHACLVVFQCSWYVTHSISVEVHGGRASSLLIISILFFVDIMQ